METCNFETKLSNILCSWTFIKFPDHETQNYQIVNFIKY